MSPNGYTTETWQDFGIDVRDKNNRLVGRLRYIFPSDRQDVIYINYVGVKKRYQGRGFGHMLYEKFLEELRTKHPGVYWIQGNLLSKGALKLHLAMLGKPYEVKGNPRFLPKKAHWSRFPRVRSRYQVYVLHKTDALVAINHEVVQPEKEAISKSKSTKQEPMPGVYPGWQAQPVV